MNQTVKEILERSGIFQAENRSLYTVFGTTKEAAIQNLRQIMIEDFSNILSLPNIEVFLDSVEKELEKV